MSDLSQFPPLHPKRVELSLKIWSDPAQQASIDDVSLMLTQETACKALEVVQKLQTGFGFAPDLYDKVEMAKTTFGQGKRIHETIKALLKLK